MKEFDFEELDRAVNSLMGDVKKQDTSPQSNASPITSVPPQVSPAPTAPVSEENVVVTLPESPEMSPPPAPELSETPPAPYSSVVEPTPPTPASPLLTPRRGGGRFMDVVHPSSDMSTSPTQTPPALPSTRQGKPLQPLTMSNEVKPSGPIVDVITPVTPPAPAPEASEPESLTVEDEPSTADSTPLEPATKQSVSSDPWSSPFLPDAQVEKRPLGGLPESPATGLSDAIAAELNKEVAPPEPAVEPAKSPETNEPSETQTIEKPTPHVSNTPQPVLDGVDDADEPTVSKTDTQLSPSTDSVVMPAELNNDLVAIESGQKSISPAEEAKLSGSFEKAANTQGSAPAALSTSSIPPQYNEQPSSGDATHTPIYDNEAAHQPLAHPAKKKKGWVLIIFIIGILLIGGGLGAVAYFLGLS